MVISRLSLARSALWNTFAAIRYSDLVELRHHALAGITGGFRTCRACEEEPRQAGYVPASDHSAVRWPYGHIRWNRPGYAITYPSSSTTRSRTNDRVSD